MYQIAWTPLAIETYEHILEFIFNRSSIEVVIALEKKVNDLEDKLKVHQYLCPSSQVMIGIRRCVITKYTSMLYRVKEDTVEILAFFDNRTDHPF